MENEEKQGLGNILPKIQETSVTKSLFFGDRVIVLRPWKTKDERNFLIKKAQLSKQDQEDEEKIRELIINDLIQPCVVSGDLTYLSFNELKKVMLELRCISIGEEVDGVTFRCSHCNGHNEISVIIDDDLVRFTPCNTELQTIDDNIKIRFKSIPFRLIRKNSNDIDLLYSAISEIYYNDTQYKNFTKQDFQDFFDSLGLKVTKSIIKKLEETTDKLDMRRIIRCNKCSKENMIDYGEIPNFFIP